MRTDPDRATPLASPLDPFITEALTRVAEARDVPLPAVAEILVRELEWLPGFADVVIGILKTNRLIVVNEWEPGKIHVTDRGRRWLVAHAEPVSVS
jgi:hypothetical protein